MTLTKDLTRMQPTAGRRDAAVGLRSTEGGLGDSATRDCPGIEPVKLSNETVEKAFQNGVEQRLAEKLSGARRKG
jgi:hypothetical protein